MYKISKDILVYIHSHNLLPQFTSGSGKVFVIHTHNSHPQFSSGSGKVFVISWILCPELIYTYLPNIHVYVHNLKRNFKWLLM